MGSSRSRVLDALVVAQTALALVLLVGSGLMVRSFHQLRSVDPGFDAEGVLTLSLTVGTQDRAERFYFPLLERLAAVPGVTSVAGTESLPMTGVVPAIGSTLGLELLAASLCLLVKPALAQEQSASVSASQYWTTGA